MQLKICSTLPINICFNIRKISIRNDEYAYLEQFVILYKMFYMSKTLDITIYINQMSCTKNVCLAFTF